MDKELARLTVDEALLTELRLPDWIFDLFRFRIISIEVTQAIQYNRAASHLTDPADRGADNSVRLVVGKAAWVRVYVRAGLRSADIPGVTGTLTVSRREFGFFYPPGVVLAPQPPGTVTARTAPAYATERGTLDYSLNFIIPADTMCGHLRLTAAVQSPSGATDTMTILLDVTLRQTLRLAGILVGYSGPANSSAGAPNLTLAAPTLANLQTTAATTLLMYPVQNTATYRSAGTITWNLPLTDPPSCPGCCTPNWIALNTAVDAQRTADGNRTDVLYYGLMAPGIPMGPVIGCNTGGVSTGSANDGLTMAHELGHACGFSHAPCGTPGDPNYPAYEPYDPASTPQASIGEYGFNISNGSIPTPNTFKDYMSYCAPRWISLYNYGRLINNTALDPVIVCQDHWWWRDYLIREPLVIPEKWLPDPPPDPLVTHVRTHVEPVISVIGVMHGPKQVEVTSVMRVDAESTIRGGRQTALQMQLVGSDGRVAAQGAVYALRASACSTCGSKDDHGNGYPMMFQAFVPDIKEGAALRLVDGEAMLWDRPAPVTRPRLGSFNARVRRPKGARASQPRPGIAIEATWDARCRGDVEPEAAIQWSSDRGKTWYALASLLRGSEANLDAVSLPSGRVDLRLLVSDGFYTVRSKPVAVTLPPQDPIVSIMAPTANSTVVAGRTMRLWGAVTMNGGGGTDAIKATWTIDDREVSDGLDAFVIAPKAGKHRARLTVAVRGRRTVVSVEFVSVRIPSTPELEGGTAPTR